jgi:hypothetical protein
LRIKKATKDKKCYLPWSSAQLRDLRTDVGISDLAIQALSGHKSHEIMEHYSHVARGIDYASARDKLAKAVDL